MAEATLGQKLAYYTLYGFMKLLGLLPEWLLYYPVTDLLYFIMYHVIHYRVAITRSNLLHAFPDKSDAERKIIEKRYYRHLAEICIDTIDLTGIGCKRLRRRMVIENEDAHRRATEDIDWIADMSHYGAWEYFIAYSAGEKLGRDTIGVYRPLHNRVMNMIYCSIRSRMNMTPVPMTVFLRHVINNRRNGVKMTIGLIADQAPPWFHRDYWFDFLNQPTAFFDGPESIAMKFGMPVYFTHIEKTSRAHYKVRFEMIYDGHEAVAPHEITRRYVSRLEKMICERPELWLWSHRRWKHKPTSEELDAQHSMECQE